MPLAIPFTDIKSWPAVQSHSPESPLPFSTASLCRLLVGFSLHFEVPVLIQETDTGLRAQWDVVLISLGFAVTVLFLFCSSFVSSLQQLLEP